MSSTDDAIHADGTADGPAHEGTSLGMDTPPGPPVPAHGPADDPAGAGGTSGLSDGEADGPFDQTTGAAGFDGTLDSPAIEEGKVTESEDPSEGPRQWTDEGADETQDGSGY